MAVVVESKVQCLCAIFIMGNSIVDEMKFVCPVFTIASAIRFR